MGISSALGSQALLPAGLGFRNLIINGDFRINQRAFTSTTTSDAYGFDRWTIFTGGGLTYSAQTFTAGNAIPGQEPINFARLATSGQSASSSYSIFTQKIESVRTCAGQPVTISFWAKASSGTPKVAIELAQIFGTSGSAAVDTYINQVTLSTSWVRYVVNTIVPSISGKTIGTANDYFGLTLWTSAGSNFNARTGSLGIQNSTIDFWGIQLEQNYQPTPFEQRPIGVELALCQRYFQTIGADRMWAYNRYWNVALSGGDQAIQFEWKTTMRVAPTVTTTAGSRVHAFTYASYNTGTVVYNLEEVGTSTDTCGSMGYYSTNNGGTFLAVGYTSGRNNNTMWVNAEL
jgi:hypothetical protein